MSVFTKFLPAPPPAPPILVVPGDRFFVRRVSLLADQAVSPQIRLALEGMAPFPPDQLYYGHLVAADGGAALVFGAYRRRFDAAEIENWPDAALVTPEFAILAQVPPTGAQGFIRVHSDETRITVLAWGVGDVLPAVVLIRAVEAANEEALIAEVRARAGLTDEVVVEKHSGVLAGQIAADGQAVFTSGENALATLPGAWITTSDVRDPEFLDNRVKAQVRDLWLWRSLLAAAAVFAIAALVEVTTAGLRWQTHRRETRVKEQADLVQQIDTAQALSNRIAELSEKRLVPFEMLATVNPPRPDSVVFQRTVTRGLHGLEIEAQAGNAEDVGAYAAALKKLPELADVKTREVRARDGVTSFVLALEFKPEAFRQGGTK